MEGTYYEYFITFWDEVDQENAERCGVTYAESCCEAVENISGYYGECNIQEIKITPLEHSTVYEFDFEK